MHSCKIVLLQLFVILQIQAKFSYPWLEQISRQEKLISKCNQFGLDKTSMLNITKLDHILVDHKHKLLYCYVPKIACTNWKRVFMILTGTTSVANPIEIPGFLAHSDNSTLRLSQLEEFEARKCLNNYTIFLMVRHPFERLLSAYRNKFEDTYSHYFQMRYGRFIIKKYRPNASSQDLETGSNVNFHEFIKYILDSGSFSNEHWQSVYDLCHPCSINYNFIGRYESLIDDSKVLLDLVGAPLVNFPFTKVANTTNKLRYYFQQVSLRDLKKLYKLYELDFRLFGYDLENLLGYDLA